MLPPQYSAAPTTLAPDSFFFCFFPTSLFKRWTFLSHAVKSLWWLKADSLFFPLPVGCYPFTQTRNPLNANFEPWMCFAASCTWTLGPLMLNLQDVWAVGVGVGSTADKCDAVCFLKQSDVSSCGAMWNSSVVQELRPALLSLPIPPLHHSS